MTFRGRRGGIPLLLQIPHPCLQPYSPRTVSILASLPNPAPRSPPPWSPVIQKCSRLNYGSIFSGRLDLLKFDPQWKLPGARLALLQSWPTFTRLCNLASLAQSLPRSVYTCLSGHSINLASYRPFAIFEFHISWPSSCCPSLSMTGTIVFSTLPCQWLT